MPWSAAPLPPLSTHRGALSACHGRLPVSLCAPPTQTGLRVADGDRTMWSLREHSSTTLTLAVSAVAIGTGSLYLLSRRRRSVVAAAEAATAAAAKHLCIFHCGEQPDVAQSLCDAAVSHGFDATIYRLDEFEDWTTRVKAAASEKPPPPCILIVTTGEDLEIASPAAHCLRFLARKSNGPETLRGISFAVLGLGDSNFLAASHRSISWASGKDCNQGGEMFDRWLEQIGGTRVVRRGESDARTDHDALEPWMDTLWSGLQSALGSPGVR